MTPPVTVRSSPTSDRCYLSTVRIEKLRAVHNVKVEWVHLPLHPDTPAEGRSLADLFGRPEPGLATITGLRTAA
jgi:hypothetical protein